MTTQVKKIASPSPTMAIAYQLDRFKSGPPVPMPASATATRMICQYKRTPSAAAIRPMSPIIVPSRTARFSYELT